MNVSARDFILGLSSKINPEALAGKQDTSFHFKLAGEGGGDFTAAIEKEQLTIKEGLEGTAKCVISCTADVMMEIVRKERNPTMAFMTGKIKVSNIGELTKYAKTFGLM
jgi:putative sterol carrier protein